MSDEAREAVGDYQFGFHDPENATIRFDKGLSEQVVRDISALKDEPEWMTDIRVKAYHHFMERPMPDWGNCGELNNIDFDNVTYFLRSSDATEKDWDDVPTTSSEPSTDWAFPKPNRSGWAVSQHSTNPKPSTTPFVKIWKRKACSSSTWTAV